MDAVETNLFEYGFKSFVGVTGMIGAWLWNSLVADVKTLKREHDKLKDDHLAYKTSVAENYVAKPEINQLKDQLSRLDEKIDDIKNMLMVTRNGGH